MSTDMLRRLTNCRLLLLLLLDGESEGGGCDEVICTRWGEPGGEWTG